MTDEVQILLVEDNPDDVKLALHAFKKHNLANRVHVARDGAEALEFIFCTGAYAHRLAGGTRHRGELSIARQQLHRQAGGLRSVHRGSASTGLVLAPSQSRSHAGKLG